MPARRTCCRCAGVLLPLPAIIGVLSLLAIVAGAAAAAAEGNRYRRQGPWRSPPAGFRGGHSPWRETSPQGFRGPPGPGPGAASGQQQAAGGGFRGPPTDNDGYVADSGAGPGPGPGRPRQDDGCVESITTMNGGQTTCSGQLIFEDNFNDLEQWNNDVHMAGAPDYEFVVYKNSPWNIYIDNGIMTIKAFLSEDKYGPGFVSNGTMVVKRCTSNDPDLCQRTAFSYNILPPVRSSRIHTADNFAFRYGVVEMRVRGPRGDWLYPQLTLKPAQSQYGPHFSSGEIRLPSHFGNKFLREAPGGPGSPPGQRGWRGRKLMRAGVAVGVKGDNDATLLTVESRAPQDVGDWSRVFHVVRMKWAPDGFEFWVDGESVGRGKVPVPHPGGFASLTANPTTHAWARGQKNAPFDQEFYLSIGLGVGGLNRFPDNVTNGQNAELPKPWKNTSPKAMLNFWKAKDQWFPTWQSPQLQVSYAKVWAL